MDRRRLAVVCLVAALIAVPPLQAGTADDPEITDPGDDVDIAGSSTTVEDHLDITQAWVQRSDGAIEFTIRVQGSGSHGTVAETINARWNFLFTANGSDWRAELDWTGTPGSPTATMYQDGSEFQTSISQTVSGQDIILTWEDGVDTVGATAELTNLYAYTRANQGEDADCHGTSVVDCAPDSGFGENFPVAGAVAGLNLTAATDQKTAGKGASVTFAFAVTNTADDTKNVTFGNDLPDDWNASMTPQNATVQPNGTNQTLLSATVPEDQEAGNVTFNVTATVDDDSLSKQMTVQVVNETGPAYDVSVSISQASKSAAPGESVTYEMQVSNVGRLDDSYNVHADSGDSDIISYSETLFSVGAGNTTTIEATVTVPSDASDGDTFEHVVAFHSENEPQTVEDTVTLTTTAEGGGDDDGGGLGIFGGDSPFTQYILIGALLLLILILVLVAILIKNRRERRLVGADEDEDDENVYEP